MENADLVSYGLFGLIDAIQKFDLERKLKFETYALSRIRGAIIDELRGLDWVPRSIRARSRRSNAPTLHWKANCSAYPATLRSPSDLASTSSRCEVFAAVSFTHVAALDELLHAEEGCDPWRYRRGPPGGGARRGPGRLGDQEHLGDRRRPVGEREKIVVALYYYEGFTLAEIGQVLGVSESRVSQLHTKAMLQLKSRMAEVD